MNKRQIIKDFVRMKKGMVLDPLLVMRMMQEEWDLMFDWHEASIVLDNMNTLDEVVVVGHTRAGMTQYRFKEVT